MREQAGSGIMPVSVGSGRLMLDDGSLEQEVLWIGDSGLLVARKPAARRKLRLHCSVNGGEIVRSFDTSAVEPYAAGERRGYLLSLRDAAGLARIRELHESCATSFGELLAIANDPGVASHSRASATGRRLGRISLTGAAAVLAAALFLVSAYYRYGVVSLSGSIHAKRIELVRAETAGTFFPYAPRNGRPVQTGELIGMVEGANGRSVGVAATCDCFVGDFPLNAGSAVFKGAPLVRLIPTGSPVEIVASLPVGEAWQIAPGDPVRIELDAATAEGHVVGVETDRRAALGAGESQGSGTFSALRIVADTPIDPTFIGSEAVVKVLRGQALAARVLAYLRG
jgi:hypothetical protein